MKISDITIKSFKTYADRFDVGHARPMPDTPMMQTVLTIHTDEGVEGQTPLAGAEALLQRGACRELLPHGLGLVRRRPAPAPTGEQHPRLFEELTGRGDRVRATGTVVEVDHPTRGRRKERT